MGNVESGRLAKKEGHKFEHLVADYLTQLLGDNFLVEGDSSTKVDVLNASSSVRLSVKNPSGKNTQVSLITQDNFIAAMKIEDKILIDFIRKFFGGSSYSNFSRHRMTKSDIDSDANQAFLGYLNDLDIKSKLFDLIVTTGYNQRSDVNYMIWAKTKNSINDVILVDLQKFKDYYMKGEWSQNETTFEYNVNGVKLFHLQMKGSGKKYTNSYHAMMFHIYGGNIADKYVEDITVLKG